MSWSVRINKLIRELFKDDKELMNRLLKNDQEAIREIGAYSNIGFTSEDIVNAYKNNKVDELYKIAERKTKIRILYYELIGEEAPKALIMALEK